MPMKRRGPLRRLMHWLGRLTPPNERGERIGAVAMLRRMEAVRDLARGGPLRRAAARAAGRPAWPVVAGDYVVGDRAAPVAVCTLTSADLPAPLARLAGVAIAGRLHTVNLGIEKIVVNITANPAIRVLLVCGVESPVFHPGAGLVALWERGVSPERRIIGATGHLPVLGGVSHERIAAFRRQVTLVDCGGETDLAVLAERVRALAAAAPGPLRAPTPLVSQPAGRFIRPRPGGRRRPIAYDPKGFFVIELDRAAGEIVVRHYWTDATPAHELRGRSGEALLLGLLRERLVSQLSHAGYLGAELAKAETAPRLGLAYEQDRVPRWSRS
jgi:tetrahydromethanopterin S-methyltransferase subunit A